MGLLEGGELGAGFGDGERGVHGWLVVEGEGGI